MSLNRYKTKGSKFYFDTVNPPVAQVAQLGDSTLDLGDREALIDGTTQDNSTGTTDLMDNGFKAPPKLDGTLIYDPSDTVHESMRAAHAAGTILYVKVVLPDTAASNFIFQARIQKASVPLPVKGKMEMQFSAEGIGSYTFAQT